MDKEELIKKACYLVDLIEDVLAAVESCKPAESLPLYHYKPEEYTLSFREMRATISHLKSS